jgi:serine/threonine protein kinase/tetratricopeptide (TPR) repeat protein/TolB-like protein
MGVVYRARDERLNRDVALKVLPVEMLADATAVKSFREEAQALSKLNHPNIATIHDFDMQDGLNFLVMEYIPGITLDQKIAAGTFPEKEVVRLGVQLAQGLQAAHCKGIVHRDLKPSNLRITPDCRLKILDFGLARLMVPADQDVTRTSLEGQPEAGTLPYMSPEQLLGEPADERSDVYAAGAVLYEMTTGQRLFPEKHGPRLIDAILHQSARSPRELNGQVSLGMQSIIQKALDKESEHRYQSARELQVDLERLSLSPAASQSAPTPEPSGPLPLEIAHVLFMDIVAYSKLPMDQQRHLLEELQKTVRGTLEFARAKSVDKLISLPSGDGMALVFFGDPEAPCRCALEVSRALRNNSETKLRMGIHTGPVYRVADINANRNVAGGGINVAQRVMDCGDSGHILVSKAVADVLSQISGWAGSLHDLGEVEVKHGVRLHLFNLYTPDVGNSRLPKKLCTARVSRTVGSATVKRTRSARFESGRPQRAPRVPAESTRARTAQQSRSSFGWLSVAAGVVLMVALALEIPVVKRWIFPIPSGGGGGQPVGVPSLSEGKYLAVLPLGVQGDPKTLKPVAESLNQTLSRKVLALGGMSWVVSTMATEAVAAEGDVDLRHPTERIASELGVNLIARGTVQGKGNRLQVAMSLEDVEHRRQISKEFTAAVPDVRNLEDRIYLWMVDSLKLNDHTWTGPGPSFPDGVWASSVEDYKRLDFFLKSFEVSRADQRLKNGRAAIQYYDDAVKKDPRSSLAWTGLAAASLAMYRFKSDRTMVQTALDAALKAQGLNDGLPADALPAEAHVALGSVYFTTGKTAESIVQFQRALQLSPTGNCWRRLGMAYLRTGKNAKALVAFQNAVTMEPDNWNNHSELGNAYYELGRYERALVAYHRVADVDPDNYVAYQNIGNVYFKRGRFEEATREYEKALRLQPEAAEVYSNLGTAYFYVKQYAEAVRMDEKAVAVHPNDEAVRGNLADVYFWSGEKKKAMETYDKAISLANEELRVNPQGANALGDLARYHARRGDMSLAEHYIRQARSIEPSDPDLIYEEAQVRALANRQVEALESLRMAFEKGCLPEQAKLDPELSSLHNDPGFQKLVREFQSKPN